MVTNIYIYNFFNNYDLMIMTIANSDLYCEPTLLVLWRQHLFT